VCPWQRCGLKKTHNPRRRKRHRATGFHINFREKRALFCYCDKYPTWATRSRKITTTRTSLLLGPVGTKCLPAPQTATSPRGRWPGTWRTCPGPQLVPPGWRVLPSLRAAPITLAGGCPDAAPQGIGERGSGGRGERGGGVPGRGRAVRRRWAPGSRWGSHCRSHPRRRAGRGGSGAPRWSAAPPATRRRRPWWGPPRRAACGGKERWDSLGAGAAAASQHPPFRADIDAWEAHAGPPARGELPTPSQQPRCGARRSRRYSCHTRECARDI